MRGEMDGSERGGRPNVGGAGERQRSSSARTTQRMTSPPRSTGLMMSMFQKGSHSAAEPEEEKGEDPQLEVEVKEVLAPSRR